MQWRKCMKRTACGLPDSGVLACESLQLAELRLVNLSLNLNSSLGMTGYRANVFGMNPLFETSMIVINLNILSLRPPNTFACTVIARAPIVSICKVSGFPT